jgi:predicted nuclease of restriction endonuclease-like RecB superfamily
VIAVPSVTDLRLYATEDEPRVSRLLDLVERSLGDPWRVLLDRIEHAALHPSPPRVAGIVGALRRVLGGRAERARIARKVRARVLGHPALDRDARDARIAIAAADLGLVPSDVEDLLWADLARERPVALPSGRPPVETLIAYANVDRIQRAVRRAREVRLRVSGEANELVRQIARFGLLADISRHAGATVFRITGPLTLFHATTVYGRALAELVPLLAAHPRFVLDICCDFARGERILRVLPPVALPPVPPPRRRRPSLAERLARDLEALGVHVEREPPPIVCGERVLFPELAVEHVNTRWLVEVMGFSTAEFIADKLARYEAARIRSVILCCDEARSGAEPATDSRVVPYRQKIDARSVLAVVGWVS